MRRDELTELHYITPIGNIPSICRLGILSHQKAGKVKHESIAMQRIQDRRSNVIVPGTRRRLHEYVNLYVCARNPMLYMRQDQHAGLCVLRVSPDVLDLPDIVITDGNASSEYVRFAAAPDGLRIVDGEMVFAEYWTDPDPLQYWRKKSAKCAEVLVPDCVDPKLLKGAYVSCTQSLTRFNTLSVRLTATVNPHLFFL